jgi:N-acetylglucosaminyldiphosphoundecaprenol N-acetyl-beta-D-mannosaminyltransferase
MPLSDRNWPSAQSRAVVFNTEAAHEFLTEPDYRRDAMPASDVYCDGVGLQVYVLLRFGRLVRRRHGPDVFHDYLVAREGARVLFLGGSRAAHEALRRRFPGFFLRNSVTCDDSTLLDSEMERKARDIVRAGYDDVPIFLGLRRQERMQHCLHAAGFRGSTIGLGAAVDFLSGLKPRAGRLWQMLGLEWMPRLFRERRMWPRVARSASLFLLVARRENAQLRSYLLEPDDADASFGDVRTTSP